MCLSWLSLVIHYSPIPIPLTFTTNSLPCLLPSSRKSPASVPSTIITPCLQGESAPEGKNPKALSLGKERSQTSTKAIFPRLAKKKKKNQNFSNFELNRDRRFSKHQSGQLNLAKKILKSNPTRYITHGNYTGVSDKKTIVKGKEQRKGKNQSQEQLMIYIRRLTIFNTL